MTARPDRIGIPWAAAMARGRPAETVLEWHFKQGGALVLPAHAFNGKGEIDRVPRLRASDPAHSLAVPDLLLFYPHRAPRFVEVKYREDGPVLYRLTGELNVGMNLDLHADYLEVQERTGLAVHVFFVHAKQDEIRTATIAELDAMRQRARVDKNLVFYPLGGLHVFAHRWSELRAGFERDVPPPLRVVESEGSQ